MCDFSGWYPIQGMKDIESYQEDGKEIRGQVEEKGRWDLYKCWEKVRSACYAVVAPYHGDCFYRHRG